MRALLQRVESASVTPDGESTRRIGRGVCTFIGITETDKSADVNYIVSKILNLRIFPSDNENSGFELSVSEIRGEILVVSQFTLYASTQKGRRPGFTQAANAEFSEPIYETAVSSLKNSGLVIKTGIFGSYMDVKLLNNGPVSMMIDSSDKVLHKFQVTGQNLQKKKSKKNHA